MRARSVLGVALGLLITLFLLLGCGGTNIGDFGSQLPGTRAYTFKGYIYQAPNPSQSTRKLVFSPVPQDLTPVSGATITFPTGDTTITDVNGYFEVNLTNISDLWDMIPNICTGSFCEPLPLPPIDVPDYGGTITQIYVLPSQAVAFYNDGWTDEVYFQVEGIDSSGFFALIDNSDLNVTINPTISGVTVDLSWGYGVVIVRVPDSVPAGTTITLTISLKSNPSVKDTATIEVVDASNPGGGSGGGSGTVGFDVQGRLEDSANPSDYSFYTIELRGVNTYNWYTITPYSDGTFYEYGIEGDDYEVTVWDDQGNWFSSTSGEVSISGDSTYDDYLNVDSDLYVTIRVIRD